MTNPMWSQCMYRGPILWTMCTYKGQPPCMGTEQDMVQKTTRRMYRGHMGT